MPYVEQTILTAQGATVAGDFTPGAAFSMATIAAMVNKSWNAAMKAEYDYNLKLAALTNPTTSTTATELILVGSAAVSSIRWEWRRRIFPL